MGLGSHMTPRSRAVWPVCITDAHLRYGRLGSHIVPRSRAVWPVCITDAHLRYGGLGGHIVTRSRVVSPVCIVGRIMILCVNHLYKPVLALRTSQSLQVRNPTTGMLF